MQIDKSNTQMKLTVSDLRLKLRTRDKEMQKEMQKVSTCHFAFFTVATYLEYGTHVLLFQLEHLLIVQYQLFDIDRCWVEPLLKQLNLLYF